MNEILKARMTDGPRWMLWCTLFGALVGAGLCVLGAHWAVAIPLSCLAGLAFGGWLRDARAHRSALRAAKNDAQALQNELEARAAHRNQELSEANAKLAAALERQTELDRRKTELFDNISHELRTPLTLILLSIEALLQRSGFSQRAKEHLQTINRSATGLLRLINNVLDLAKLESGSLRLRYEPIALGPFVRGVVQPFLVLAREKRVALEVVGEVGSRIHADAERLEAIFQNLVSNALKFTTEGGVLVRLSETETHAIIEVVDTGEGIPPADLGRIFDRFAQADAEGVRRFGGTGIGLALVKELIELHEGSISVDSVLDVGTTFRVMLPKGTEHIRESLRVPDVPKVRKAGSQRVFAGGEIDPAPKRSTGSDAAAEDESVDPMLDERRTILVVEDDPELRQALFGILRIHYDVLQAENGEEGLALAAKERPDLVLSDVMMPRMSGLQLLERMRALPELSETPVVLLTARRETEAMVEGLTVGANDYVGKPFAPRELLARIESQLRIRDAAARAATSERLASLGMVMSGFAHEVRNPLNGLLNMLAPLVSAIAEGPSEQARAQECVEVIDACGKRIRHLADGLLAFAHVGEDRAEEVDVPASLEDTVRILGWRIPPGVEISRRFDSARRVRGDPGSLNQVWLNLIDNALRAMGSSGKLTLSTEEVGEELWISVADTGVGISPHQKSRLFEPFFSTRRPGEGTGLGLALCKRIVLQHQGAIDLTSELGAGSRFTVRLPLPPSA